MTVGDKNAIKKTNMAKIRMKISFKVNLQPTLHDSNMISFYPLNDVPRKSLLYHSQTKWNLFTGIYSMYILYVVRSVRKV